MKIKKTNKCETCNKETETCVKLYVDGDKCMCVDNAHDNAELHQVWERSSANANTILKTISSMIDPLGIESESELIATMMLCMKAMIHIASDGNRDVEMDIATHISKALLDIDM